MIIDGEKYACEACVRGHRVSNCQHSDRELQHINKKGRPVSQCQHCRTMRRSKAAHVKCDCGEKTSKCMHLKNTVDGHKDSCCCNHGGRCTCCHKKEPHLDTVPESDSDQESCSISNAKPSRGATRTRRSRANTQNSDGMLTFDEHGHHKPAYKHNKAAQQSGPYPLHRVNSMQSARSLDNLDRDSPGSTDSNAPQDQRLVRSEAASPLMTGSSYFPQSNCQLPPLDLSEISNTTSYLGNDGYDGFELFESLGGLPQSAASVDWSFYDFDYASREVNDFAPSNYSQTQSFGGFEQPPPMTTSTSGEVSEVGDLIPSACAEFGSFSRTSTNSTGISLSPAQADMLANLDLNGAGFEEFKAAASRSGDESSVTTASATATATATAGLDGYSMAEEAFWMTNYGLSLVNESPDPNTDPNSAVFWEIQ